MGTLLNLPAHEQAEITHIDAEEALVRRLKDMGISAGAIVELVGRAPFAGPLIIRTRGATFALREGEAACIHVQALSRSS